MKTTFITSINHKFARNNKNNFCSNDIRSKKPPQILPDSHQFLQMKIYPTHIHTLIYYMAIVPYMCKIFRWKKIKYYSGPRLVCFPKRNQFIEQISLIFWCSAWIPADRCQIWLYNGGYTGLRIRYGHMPNELTSTAPMRLQTRPISQMVLCHNLRGRVQTWILENSGREPFSAGTEL